LFIQKLFIILQNNNATMFSAQLLNQYFKIYTNICIIIFIQCLCHEKRIAKNFRILQWYL